MPSEFCVMMLRAGPLRATAGSGETFSPPPQTLSRGLLGYIKKNFFFESVHFGVLCRPISERRRGPQTSRCSGLLTPDLYPILSTGLVIRVSYWTQLAPKKDEMQQNLFPVIAKKRGFCRLRGYDLGCFVYSKRILCNLKAWASVVMSCMVAMTCDCRDWKSHTKVTIQCL